MSDVNKNENSPLSDEELEDLVASTDSGARNPAGPVGKFIAGLALFWALFQLWIASPLPYTAIGRIIPVLNDTQTRSLHLAIAVFLAFMAYPAFKSSSRSRIPIYDWVLGSVGALCAGYAFYAYGTLAATGAQGLPTTLQLVMSGVGLLILLEAARRALGPALAIVALIFLVYVFFGSESFIPDVIRWKGASFSKAMSHMWLTTEGVFGIALGVSASFVFLFVLFGSLLDKAGAGNYFIQIAFSLLGHLRGGPAKAAVVGSAMTGLISGSSIANVVTTGTFTIPLMKRVGFTSEQAGSVEVASSVNGQIMPPVMGAAAFLMVEYIGIPYVEVIKHAFLPAVVSYIALLYIVHLEALKKGMTALPKPVQKTKTLVQQLLSTFIGFAVFGALCFGIYYGIGWMRGVFGENASIILTIGTLVIYVAMVAVAARKPNLEMDDPKSEIVELPAYDDVKGTGLHYILPIVVLVWFLMIERKSPGLSAFWASSLLIVILLTQKPLKAFFRKSGDLAAEFKDGFDDLIAGMIAGSRNMIGIGVATATAGIIVGTVTLTGVGQVMAELVEFLSGGNLIIMLMCVGVISLILGMGLPTTANYIVVSSLMAGVVVELGAQNGLIVPLIAVHMFVFYFGIMADVTPPVGLASFAAAAVSGGDPIKTGFTAFFYSLRTVALPFLFIFNTDLLLINVGWIDGIIIFIVATVAMLLFAAGTQGYFFAKSRKWESALLILIAFTLFRPGFFLDYVQQPYQTSAATQLEEVVGKAPIGSDIRIVVSGPDFDTGEAKDVTVILPVTDEGDGATRLTGAGITTFPEGEIVKLDEPFPGTPYFEKLGGFDFYLDEPVEIKSVQTAADRMPKQIFYIPALLLLGLVIMLQRRRQTQPAF
ncbi:TRAP transporter permease [Maritalea sp.]|uniref:TRAP transporter permease n=1 Tax=Maritalea sp. TaxID=2003361 RepID=UPI003EF986C0